MYTFHIHNSGSDFVSTVEHIPAQEATNRQNDAVIAHFLWIRRVDKLIAADQFSRNISNRKDYDYSMHHIYTVTILRQEILQKGEADIGKFLGNNVANVIVAL